jgi:methyl-accepting chemotaxis protein
MDEVTQQNAALVEQAAAAAESLVEQAMGLIETVSVFRLSGVDSFSANKPASRAVASRPVAKLVAPRSEARPAVKLVAKAVDKTGTNDGNWAEF